MMIRSAAITSLLLTVGAAWGQSLYNNGSIVSISSTGIVYVKDTVVNNGTIINNGMMEVGGSWVNLSQYDAGQGQITFNSIQPQVINHNDQSFSRLVISGGGEKLFLADITIEDELALSDGTLVSGNDAAIILSSDARVTGGSDDGHVLGPVYHRGEGDKIFPVGNGSIYLPVEILNVEGTAPEIGVRLIEPVGVTLAGSPSLKSVSRNRYWEIDVVSGAVNNALVVLPVRDEEIVTSSEGVVVAQSASPTDAFESLGNSGFQGTYSDGQVTSEKFLSRPYVAIATAETAIIVYNAISPNGDPLNDYLRIGNIESYPENKFILFNRWGDKVFELDNYDNKDRVFRGLANINAQQELPSGTYFYTIETKSDGRKINGFLTVKR